MSFLDPSEIGGQEYPGVPLAPPRGSKGRGRPSPRFVSVAFSIVVLNLGMTGCQRARPLSLAAPGGLPDLIGVITRDGEAIQVGDARLEGDSVLVGQVWPDDRSPGWRSGEALRLRLDRIEEAVSLAGVGARVWEIISTEHQQTPVRWQDVYVLPPGDPIPERCSRVAILFRRPLRYTSGWDGRFEPGPEQARVSAGLLGGNGVYLSWLDEDPTTGLFGPRWDYPASLAVRCPDLTAPSGGPNPGAGP